MERAMGGGGKPVRWLKPQGGPRGLLKYYILKQLSEREMTGYDLLKDIEEKTGGGWRPGTGSIYPILNQLNTLGYIRAIKEPASRSQKIYAITEKGRESESEIKSIFEKAAYRWQALRPLIFDIVDPKSLGEMMVQATKEHFQGWRRALDSEKISKVEKISVLNEIRLNLEREVRWIEDKLAALEDAESERVKGASDW
jgi:DNA-binding PadR family transcriptional regulator